MNSINIQDRLFALQDLDYRAFHIKLLGDVPKDNVIGVRVPALRAFAKELAREVGQAAIDQIGNDYYEETLVHGFLIGYCKMTLDEHINRLRTFVPLINNWAVCDCTCASLKFILKNREKMLAFIKEYLFSPNEYEVRFAVVMLLNYYLDDEYINESFVLLNSVQHSAYYVKMAVAWAVSVAFTKHEQLTLSFLQNNALDDWTYNKALQKIVESNRVPKETKEKIRKMKRS